MVLGQVVRNALLPLVMDTVKSDIRVGIKMKETSIKYRNEMGCILYNGITNFRVCWL